MPPGGTTLYCNSAVVSYYLIDPSSTELPLSFFRRIKACLQLQSQPGDSGWEMHPRPHSDTARGKLQMEVTASWAAVNWAGSSSALPKQNDFARPVPSASVNELTLMITL